MTFNYMSDQTAAFPVEKAPRPLFAEVNRTGEYLGGLDVVPGTYRLSPVYVVQGIERDYTWVLYDYVGFPKRIAAEGVLQRGESVEIEVASGQVLKLENIVAKRIG